jgi:hypothetical protein
VVGSDSTLCSDSILCSGSAVGPDVAGSVGENGLPALAGVVPMGALGELGPDTATGRFTDLWRAAGHFVAARRLAERSP